MARTDSLRQQHDALLQSAAEIAKMLVPSRLAEDPGPVVAALSKLWGSLRIHLGMEDDSLYPARRKSGDAATKAAAERFVREMGGIRATFEGYVQKWVSRDAIKADPQGFVRTTQGLLGALGERVKQENTVLYPLADKL